MSYVLSELHRATDFPYAGKPVAKLIHTTKRTVVKYENLPIEYVEATIRRPRADNIRPLRSALKPADISVKLDMNKLVLQHFGDMNHYITP